MASLSDIWSPPEQPPLGFTLANLNTQQNQALEDTGIQQSRIIRNFSQFDLPDLVSSQAARGAFATSATHRKADRARQFATDGLGDSQRILSRVLTNLAQQGVLAAGGIQL